MEKYCFARDNDILVELVLSGKKRATTYLYNELDLPIIGEEAIIQFSNEKDACIVKTVDYKILKFSEITEDFAFLEGEGDLSLNYWKTFHYEFFKSIDDNFNEDSKIIFEIFEVTRNLVNERLELAKMIGNRNIDIFGKVEIISEINSGFNNTLFNVNNKYIIKVCTNYKLEDSFKVEYNFYCLNGNNEFIPKMIKYDDSKSDVEYIYMILEKVDGDTLYYCWYKMSELERENIIKRLIEIIKSFHLVKTDSYDWNNKIKNEVYDSIVLCKSLFSENDYNLILRSIEKYDLYLSCNKFSLIHNDLHFDNVMYADGNIKIIDFNDSMIAPIDFEFRQLYMCQELPWKWANSLMDPYQKAEDYKNIWNYIKKYYKELNEINYLEERMIIYRIWNDSRQLKKYKSSELIDGIIINSKKIL